MGDTFSLEPGVGDVVAPAAVYRVPSDYASLQAAVDAVLESANTRAIIELEGPTFTGADIDLTGLTFESITLMGRSSEPNDTQLTGTLNVTLSGGAWLALVGLCFVGTVDALVVDGTGAVRMDRCRFSSSAGNAMDISGSVGVRTAGYCEFRRPIVWASDSSCELMGVDMGPINMSGGVWGPQIVASNGYMNVLSGELRGTITLSGNCVLTAGPQIWRVGAEHPITSSGTAQWQVSADSLQVFASSSKTWDTSGSVGAVALAGLVRGAVYGSPYPSTLYYPSIGGTYFIEAGVMPSVNGAAVIGGGVTAFNSRTGSVTPANGDYTASQVGADATGTAAAAVAAHEGASNPHPTYLTQAEGDAAYEPLGEVAAAIATHEAAGNPHPTYLTEAEATALFEELGEASAAVTAHEAASDPHPAYLKQAEADALYEELGAVAAAITTHEGASNPHPGYSQILGSSGTVTLANGGSTTIAHGDLGTVPPVISGVSIGSSTPTKPIILHFEGADASTTVTDSGSNGGSHTWTCGGSAQLDTAQSRFGSSALLLDTSASLQLAATPDMLFTGVFTVAGWWRFSVVNTYHILFAPANAEASPSTNFQLNLAADGSIALNANGSTICTSSAGVITTNTWFYIAVTRNDSNVAKIWVGQVGGYATEVASGSLSGNVGSSSQAFWFGRYSGGSYGTAGHMDEFMTDITCMYTGTFATPSGAWASSEETKTHLVLGTDYSAVTNTSGTTITNSSGSSYSAQFVLRS